MGDQCEPANLEDSLTLAKAAQKSGDARHAAFHLAEVLAIDPLHAEAQRLLGELTEHADDPLGLAPLEHDQPTWYGTVAARAWIMLRIGRTGEGLSWIAKVAKAAPSVPYLRWLAKARDLSAVSDEDLEETAQALLRFAYDLPGDLSADDERAPNANAALAFLDAVREERPSLPAPIHAALVLLRRFGRAQDAVPLAERLDALRGDFASAAALSATLAEAGDRERAMAASRLAASRAPEDESPWLDVGDNALALGRPQEAIEAYQEALKRAPGNDWAAPSVLYARYLLHRREEDREGLRAMTRDQPENRRAADLLREIGEPIIDFVPSPSDATANALRQLQQQEQKHDPIAVSIGLSHPEGPSNRIAYELWAASLGKRIELELSMGQIPTPDPLAPMPGTTVHLFRRTGDRLDPALDPPPPGLVQELQELAETRYSFAAWSDRAGIIGRAVGPERAMQLVAAMVHPPAPPDGWNAPSWVQRAQIACALALAQVDGGWDGSVRRQLLLSVARGPVDWTVTAAIVGLLWVARNVPASRPEVAAMYSALRQREPSAGGCTYAVSLRQAWLQLPDVDGALRARLASELEELTA